MEHDISLKIKTATIKSKARISSTSSARCIRRTSIATTRSTAASCPFTKIKKSDEEEESDEESDEGNENDSEGNKDEDAENEY
jgi:hypothetical protein